MGLEDRNQGTFWRSLERLDRIAFAPEKIVGCEAEGTNMLVRLYAIIRYLRAAAATIDFSFLPHRELEVVEDSAVKQPITKSVVNAPAIVVFTIVSPLHIQRHDTNICLPFADNLECSLGTVLKFLRFMTSRAMATAGEGVSNTESIFCRLKLLTLRANRSNTFRLRGRKVIWKLGVFCVPTLQSIGEITHSRSYERH